jgi:hypothetical protein
MLGALSVVIGIILRRLFMKEFMARIAPAMIIALIAIFGLGMAGCDHPTDDGQPTGGQPTGGQPTGEQPSGSAATPVLSDFTITGLAADADGSPKAVSITPKAGKSQGAITIYYAGTSGTTYPKSTTAPSAGGRYTVTFDVAAATGFKQGIGLSAGTLVITATVIKEEITGPKKVIDFEDGWDNTGYAERTVAWGGYAWTVSGVVTTTDDNDRRDGTKSIRLRGNVGDDCRVQLDSYVNGIKAIYFDYASYSSHSNGTIALYYQIEGGDWVKAGEIAAPSWEGEMLNAKFDINKTNVRFKIVREDGLANFTSVNIDNIIITADSEASFNKVAVAPVPADFNITGLAALHDGNPKAASITPKAGKSQGDITIWYTGTDGTSYAKSATAPSAAGKYAVTFDVAAAEGFNAASGLPAGTLEITTIADQFILIDFEDSAWAGGSYTKRTVNWSGYEWTVSGVGTMDANDRREGDRSIRFRGGNAADTGDNTNRVELVTYLTSGIKSISFDYGSYSSHSGGTIIAFYQKEGESNWTEAGRVTNIPSWTAGGSKMLNANFNVNQTGKVRFKIEKLFVGSGSISANIDNIVITHY